MLSVIQLVTQAEVCVETVPIGTIQKGIMALVGIEKTDTEKEAEKLLNKILNYRILPDTHGKMNLI
jgi:D-tyrosyl-tRNA(Tyr) deacylase